MRLAHVFLLSLAATACSATARDAAPTSVVLVVVDTLRADRLEIYGHQIATAPHVARRIAARGVVFEEAYAAAPWTLPSMISLFSGRRPGRDLPSTDPASFAFPSDRPTPAELLAARGLATAAFVGNPLLSNATGFDRGFDTFWVAEGHATAMDRHAADVTDRALAWLATAARPLFLWVHYIDPHDPYAPPELVRGLSPDDPTYRGALTGRDVHALFNGRRTSLEPTRDARFLGSLYDAEIRHVDREIDRLLDGLGPTLADTLVIFVSDHGEELFEHGGWKHGRTVWEEQLRVPLVLRFDGRLPAGERIAGPVSLVDVLPTLAEALDLELPGSLDGASLLSLIRGDEAPGSRAVTTAHYHSGPRRFAARLGRHKLLLFDRDAPTTPASPLERHLFEDERRRIPHLRLHDLALDPQERDDLSATRPDLVARLGLLALDGLDRPGRHVVALSLLAGERLTAEVLLTEPKGRWERLLLGPDDHVEIVADRLRLDWRGDGRPKAITLATTGPIELLASASGGRRVALLDGGAAPPTERVEGQTTLATWAREEGATPPPRGASPEVERALRALGYAQ